MHHDFVAPSLSPRIVGLGLIAQEHGLNPRRNGGCAMGIFITLFPWIPHSRMLDTKKMVTEFTKENAGSVSVIVLDAAIADQGTKGATYQTSTWPTALDVKAGTWNFSAIESNGLFPSCRDKRPNGLRDLFNWRPIKLLSDEISNKIINPDGLHSLQRRISISAIYTFNLKEEPHEIINKLTRSAATLKLHLSLLKQSVKGTFVQLATWPTAHDVKAMTWNLPAIERNGLFPSCRDKRLPGLRDLFNWCPIKLLNNDIGNEIINPRCLHLLQRHISISAINTFNLKEEPNEIINKLTRSAATHKLHFSILKQPVKRTSVQIPTWPTALDVKAGTWNFSAIESNGLFPSCRDKRPHELRDLFNWLPIKLLSDEIRNEIINPDGLHSLQRRISISAIYTFNLKEKLHQIFNKLTRSPVTPKFHISLLK